MLQAKGFRVTTSDPVRLFFGLGLDGELADGVARTARSAYGVDGEAYGADDLHLTLVFLGERPAGDVGRLRALGAPEFAGLHAPELVVRGEGGVFDGSADRPRAVWREVGEASGTEGRLDALRNRACQVGRMVGWRPRPAEAARTFRPHVTVARPRDPVQATEGLARLGRDRAWLVPEVALFASCTEKERAAGGGRYRILQTWNLAVGPQ